MKARFATGFFLSLFCLQGCQNTLYGPVRPFQAGKMAGETSCPPSPILSSSTAPTVAAAPDDFLESRFFNAACASAAAKADEDKLARAMLETSFSLTNARCNDYFAQKSGSQTGVNIARSIVAPAITLLTGILSIVNFKNDVGGERRADWEKGLSLASAATLAGLTIWEENFLFSSENIDDVRGLTNHAMAEYRIAILNLTGHTFDTSVNYVLQYHMICTPGRIKGLVKQAIRDKKITVVDRSTSAPVAPVAPIVPARPSVTSPVTAPAGTSLEIT